ncbi:hypothetical protein WG219_21775 [Ectopseudomonas mendocina]|uniref:Uncharacterized protein n=1 Tax=Ectopseudomonas mendocina TaxID=300 RepID=A0ABZ2RHW6_ECTME
MKKPELEKSISAFIEQTNQQLLNHEKLAGVVIGGSTSAVGRSLSYQQPIFTSWPLSQSVLGQGLKAQACG